jgi:adenylate cyclase
MGTEIERKFLVIGSLWDPPPGALPLVQGYLCARSPITVRVRLIHQSATLTIKGPPKGTVRVECEYPIPLVDAHELLQLCKPFWIQKRRHHLEWAGRPWIVDQYEGKNEGLIVAEAELSRENETLLLPPWVGLEITGDPRYQNAHLARHPFLSWKHSP